MGSIRPQARHEFRRTLCIRVVAMLARGGAYWVRRLRLQIS
jgi:hypothetical protein